MTSQTFKFELSGEPAKVGKKMLEMGTQLVQFGVILPEDGRAEESKNLNTLFELVKSNNDALWTQLSRLEALVTPTGAVRAPALKAAATKKKRGRGRPKKVGTK